MNTLKQNQKHPQIKKLSVLLSSKKKKKGIEQANCPKPNINTKQQMGKQTQSKEKKTTYDKPNRW